MINENVVSGQMIIMMKPVNAEDTDDNVNELSLMPDKPSTE